MDFISRAVKKKYESGTNYKLGQSLTLAAYSGADDNTATSVLRKNYNSIVQTCVSIIAREIAKHPLKLYKTNLKGELEEVTKHDALDLIRNPNPYQTEYDMSETIASYRELVGEYFIAVNLTKDSRRPAELNYLRPDLFTIHTDKTGNIAYYEYHAEGGGNVNFMPDEIIHEKTFNPVNRYRGIGTVQSHIRSINIEDSASQYTKSFFDNNATPAGIVAVKGHGDITFGDEAHQKLKAKWNDEFKGSKNAGKVAFLQEAEVDYKQIGLGLNEIDMEKLRNMTETAIYKAFGIPAIYTGDYQNMNYASSVTAKSLFIENTVMPRLIKRQQTWQKFVDTFWAKEKLVVKYENVVPSDQERTLAIAEKGSLIGLTENEKRNLVGFDALPSDQGDTVWRPMNSVEYPVGTKTKIKFARKQIDEAEIVKSNLENEAIRKESYRATQEKLQLEYEKKYQAEMKEYLKEQNELVINNLSPKKGLKDILFSITQETKKLREIQRPLIARLYNDSAMVAVDFLGLDIEFTPINTEVDEYIRNQINKVALEFNETTRDKLVDVLSEAYVQGESISTIAKLVDGVYKEAGASGYSGKNGYRAKRLARTEVIRANNHAALESYRQLGVTKKEWKTNAGACAQCEPFNGTVIGVSQNFLQEGEEYIDADGVARTNTYENVEHPALHPNCRCAILPVRS